MPSLIIIFAKLLSLVNKAGNSVSNYTVTFNEDTKCDILIVGGGGSGGTRDAGAGGAGGIILLENQLVTTAEISVGKGGNAVSSLNYVSGNKGQNSTFQITTGGEDHRGTIVLLVILGVI